MIREAIYRRSSGEHAYLLSPNTLDVTIRAKRNDLENSYLCYNNVDLSIDGKVSRRYSERVGIQDQNGKLRVLLQPYVGLTLGPEVSI